MAASTWPQRMHSSIVSVCVHMVDAEKAVYIGVLFQVVYLDVCCLEEVC